MLNIKNLKKEKVKNVQEAKKLLLNLNRYLDEISKKIKILKKKTKN